MNICAGIVLYNPDISRLKQNIEAIAPQVIKIILVDNGSDNLNEIKEVINGSFIWIENQTNKGIAKALNQLVESAKQNGFDWIVTLDQDSIASEGMVKTLYETALTDSKIAMVSPYIIDDNIETVNDYLRKSQLDTEYVLMCLTSGALTAVNSVLFCGGFNDWMFIDQVDHDMCLRLINNGYKIVKANNVYLHHEIGVAIKRKFLWKTILYHNHNPYRVYYQARNMIYMARRYNRQFTLIHPVRYVVHMINAFIVKFILEPVKFKRLFAFSRGLFDGLTLPKEDLNK